MQRVTTPANLQLSPSEPDTTLESPQQCQKRRNPSTWVTSSQPPAQDSIPATGRRLPSGADRSPAAPAPAPGRRPPRPAGQPAPGSPGALVVPLPGQPGRRQDGLHDVIQQRRNLNGRSPVLAGQTGHCQPDHLRLGGRPRWRTPTAAPWRSPPPAIRAVRYWATSTGAAGSQGTPTSSALAKRSGPWSRPPVIRLENVRYMSVIGHFQQLHFSPA